MGGMAVATVMVALTMPARMIEACILELGWWRVEFWVEERLSEDV
jgi:hypothetical protein